MTHTCSPAPFPSPNPLSSWLSASLRRPVPAPSLHTAWLQHSPVALPCLQPVPSPQEHPGWPGRFSMRMASGFPRVLKAPVCVLVVLCSLSGGDEATCVISALRVSALQLCFTPLAGRRASSLAQEWAWPVQSPVSVSRAELGGRFPIESFQCSVLGEFCGRPSTFPSHTPKNLLNLPIMTQHWTIGLFLVHLYPKPWLKKITASCEVASQLLTMALAFIL